MRPSQITFYPAGAAMPAGRMYRTLIVTGHGAYDEPTFWAVDYRAGDIETVRGEMLRRMQAGTGGPSVRVQTPAEYFARSES